MANKISRAAHLIVRQVSIGRTLSGLSAIKPCCVFHRCYSSVEEFVIKSPRPDVVIPRIPLHELVWQKHEAWADKVAVECGATKRKYTYSQARSLSHSLASALQNGFQLTPGDCLAILSPNVPEYPMLLLAAAEVGLVATTINPIYTPDEIKKQLKDSNSKLIITTTGCYNNAAAALQKLGTRLPVLVIKESKDVQLPEGGIAFDEVVQKDYGPLKSVEHDVESNVVLPYSSGTTGLPKGVQLSHFNLVSNLLQMNARGTRLLLETTATQQDVVICLLPMFHIYGMVVVALSTLIEGGKLVTLPRFEPKLFISSLVEHKVGLMYLVPPLVLFLGGHPDVKPEYLSSIRAINSGAAPIGFSDVERLQRKAPHINFYQGYGMTETSPVTLMTHHDRIHKYASTGVLLSNTHAMIVDAESGKSLSSGKVGELFIRGPQVMKGYFNRMDANEEIFRNGWLRTGDLAYYDEEGDFYVVDRLKELIKVKGFQVAPAELEEILRAHPQVSDAAVIGVTDERCGEVPRAFVVAKQGITLDVSDVASYVAGKVSEYKQLAGGIVQLPAIPKSAAGKILRKELRKKYGEKIVRG